MIDKIIQFSIKNKMIVGLFTLGLIIFGIFSAARLKIDSVPDITNNQVVVLTLAPTLSTQEVEKFITFEMEIAMATLPDLIELRSISRSGLSVITVIFKDNVDMYLARQLVNERIKDAEGRIPKGLGAAQLAPISTGLGEIYHYILDVKSGYEKKYSAMELRTIQDWIIRRQLAGTPGVADISAWGGLLKQYEISVSPDKLNSMHISISEIFEALEKNNQSTGGAYIEKFSNVYYIRGIGLISSFEDINNIVVKTINNVPVYIRDIANVGFGSAIRYGAVTHDGEGEVVGGIILMLKGANSNEVIRAVKEKIAQIQKTLPEGVVIQPYLDRSKLVNNTISTVVTNLTEGALIVIFILVLLVGQLRAGLIIVSVIPLSMLFAISMMNIFGVSGNLMSLGAIDFGIIVDGAVIIVESVVHRISLSKHHHVGLALLSREQMDTQVYQSATWVRKSSAFGVIIVLIVYLPILALTGIEGKMFKPMAQTVGSAILGAFLLSLTYIPMMCSVALSKKTEHKRNISDKIMDVFHKIYKLPLEFALKRKFIIVAISLILLISSLVLFLNLGGEFIPTLEEGDLTVEFAMMQGTSLSQMVESCTLVEKVLKEKFPEVIHAISRIGSAEIPSDPMPIERADIMLNMKPKKEWVSAKTKEEMFEKMEEAISEAVPGAMIEMTQPIQMRFNELLAGIRQDVAVKIYGEDLDLLVDKANDVSRLISGINGVTQPIVERVAGLPQITVEYKREKISQYGLSISDVNRALKTAFAGEVAGVVFEGEKKFDMIVRLSGEFRHKIEDVQSLYIPLPSGNQVPINQVADIEFKEGPAQISRENTQRRIFVGFNIRGRDVESVIVEVQKTLDAKLKLPPGYFIKYGGQFENLMAAKKSLSVSVPIVLLLILILLYFTFHSFKEVLLIFTAIPLSAVGGVFALVLRGMPFSISAGVGFIALFGVAVLNGIVLISEFNRLEKEEPDVDIYDRVRKGTKHRLRPVIMTAAVASFGFLPMALSTQAGAEVQRPLATVVIGGLLTATMLTLLVLPVFYIIFSTKKPKKSINIVSAFFFIVIPLFSFQKSSALDNNNLSLDDAINVALKNNLQYQIADLERKQQNRLLKSTFDLPGTNFSITRGQYNSGYTDNYFEVSQNFSFPTTYFNQYEVQSQNVAVSEINLDVVRAELIRQVKSSYYRLVYGIDRLKLYNYLDSVIKNLKDVAALKYKTGESSRLEQITLDTRYNELRLFNYQAARDIEIFTEELKKILNISYKPSIIDTSLTKLSLPNNIDTTYHIKNPFLSYYQRKIQAANSVVSLEYSKLLPGFSIGYFNQSLDGIKGFQGFSLGINIPIFFWSQQGRIQASEIQSQIAGIEYENYKKILTSSLIQHLQEYRKYSELNRYYESTGLNQADVILQTSQIAWQSGEIGYVEFIQNLSQSINIKIQYLDNLNNLNQTIININYITGNN